MSQFASLYKSGVTEAVAAIGDSLTYEGKDYACIASEETYENQLTDGGFEPTRAVTACLVKADAPDFVMGRRVTIGAKSYRIVGIEDDGVAIEIRCQSPETR